MQSKRKILKGIPPPITLSTIEKNLLTELQSKVSHIPLTQRLYLSGPITRTEFQHYWRRARESTSRSHSLRHFGHYKTIATDDFLSDIFTMISSICLLTGYALKRWRTIIDAIIEKIPG